MMHEVFISYEHRSKAIADRIVSVLESRRVRCWYAPRDVVGDYATSIVEAIRNSKVFVLILSQSAAESPHVLNEIEIAYQQIIDGVKLVILPLKIDEALLSMAMEYYIKRFHWIDAINEGMDKAILSLVSQVEGVVKPSTAAGLPATPAHQPPAASGRKRERYYRQSSAVELNRLMIQNAVMREFDAFAYDSLLNSNNQINLLDIGCSRGVKIIDRIETNIGHVRLLGIDSDPSCIESANSDFGSDRATFLQCDCESRSFDAALGAYLSEKNIAGFDVCTMSMVLLHLRNPYRVLKTVRRYMADGGSILIEDIDDALKIAYPDEDGSFRRAIEIDAYTDISGFRQSGRQVFGLLMQAGFEEIRLLKEGLTTIGMNRSQRLALFDACFSYITENLQQQCLDDPSNERYAEDLEWLEDAYDDMEASFVRDDFFFQAPMMLFHAVARNE